MTLINKRLERLERRKPVPKFTDVINARAEFFMRCFEKVCVDCEDRAKYPHCPRTDCDKLFQAHVDEAALLDENDPRERAMMEGVANWREKRINRSDWLKGGFALFAYEDDEYNEMIYDTHVKRNG